MTLKSLLTSMMVVGASTSAFAFADFTLYPEPGDYTDYQMFETFNLTGKKITVITDADKPYFYCEDSGDEVQATMFSNFADTILLKFESSEFTENGEWILTFPAGCMKDGSGNLNEQLTYTYNLKDPNLNIGDYPQITLVSSDPANGATLPFWGAYIGKITFKTSDDAAVNYIQYSLYDVTDGDNIENKLPIRIGNENRIDFNRYHHNNDIWADGLFVTVEGYNEPLLIDHNYRLVVDFCGIGYNPETNQYPSPDQINKSLELSTSIYFKGQSEPTEYSPYEVKEVTPNPEDYDFDNIDMRTFTIFYTGPVKPSKFVYSEGQGAGTSVAGEFAPETEANADGYADAWNFTFSKEVLQGVTGNIAVTIEASDADGLPVKGNGDFESNNFEYHIDWLCNLGADVLVSVEPENGATVKSISSITVTNDAKKEMNLAGLTVETPYIVKMGRAGFETVYLGEPDFSEDGREATWTLEEPIIYSGTYSLIIPKQYFIMGEQMLTSVNNQTNFVYIVDGDEPPAGDVEEDLEPVEVSIKNNANLTEPLEKIVISFAEVTYMTLDPVVPGKLYHKVITSAQEDEYELVEEVNPVENDYSNPTEYTYTFSNPVSEKGDYKFIIPARTFYDVTYDETGGESGHATPELIYNFSIGEGSGIEAIMGENDNVTVYDIAGRVVLNNADAAAVKALNNGVYIVNGKKFVVK